jgi:hypothetical protein
MSIMSDFDRLRQTLLKKGTAAETWGAEVRRYLNEVEADVTKDTDIVKWWEVWSSNFMPVSLWLTIYLGTCTNVPNSRQDRSRHPPLPSILCTV